MCTCNTVRITGVFSQNVGKLYIEHEIVNEESSLFL